MPLTPDQLAEIEQQRASEGPTRRATVPDLEALLYQALPVLDHGFVRVVDYMGDDAAVVQAARVSYGRGTRRVSEDSGLIRYLMRHRHSTPFEMCEIKYHVKLPIFVARQWIRHRTANVNEYSARYSILDREFYLPAPEHLAAQSSSNRQGRGGILGADEAETVLEMLRDDATRTYDHYTLMLNEDGADPARKGLARELARMNLTLNTYTQWYWKTDLHNLLGFLSLRADPHAQFEIRAYADAMLDTVRAWVPATFAAFQDYRLGAATLSSTMLTVVRRMLAGETVDQAASGLSKREWGELMENARSVVILVFGSINVDLIFALERLPHPGETLLGPGVLVQPGGKGANQAVAAARDGAQVVMVGAVGRDPLADAALAILREAEIDLRRINEVEQATGCAAICTDREGRNLIAVGSGANLRARADDVEDMLLGPGTTLVLQHEVTPAETETLIRRAHAAGSRIVLNLAPAAPLDPTALRLVDFIVVNEHEAAWLAKFLGVDEGAIQVALGTTVIRTLGERGAAYAGTSGDGVVPALDVAVVDTTAAGDCFTGVLAAALDRDLTLPAALARASVAAGLCCTKRGSQASLPLRQEIDDALGRL